MKKLYFFKENKDYWLVFSLVSIVILTKGLANGMYSNLFEFITFLKLCVMSANSVSYFYHTHKNYVDTLFLINLILYICLL